MPEHLKKIISQCWISRQCRKYFSGDDRSFDYLPMITISSHSNLYEFSYFSLGMEDEDFIGQLIIKENEAQ